MFNINKTDGKSVLLIECPRVGYYGVDWLENKAGNFHGIEITVREALTKEYESYHYCQNEDCRAIFIMTVNDKTRLMRQLLLELLGE